VLFKFPSLDKNVTGLAVKAQLDSTNAPDVGATVRARVLDVDRRKRVIDLSLKNVPSSGADAAKTLKAIRQLRTAVRCCVELIKTHYLVLSVPSVSNALVYASPASDYNHTSNLVESYKIGEKLDATFVKLLDKSVPLFVITANANDDDESSTNTKVSQSKSSPLLKTKRATPVVPFDGVQSVDEVHEGKMARRKLDVRFLLCFLSFS
jgi:ribosomal protein S1